MAEPSVRSLASRVPGARRVKQRLSGDEVRRRLLEVSTSIDGLAVELRDIRSVEGELQRSRQRVGEVEAHLPHLMEAVSIATGTMRRIQREVLDLRQVADEAAANEENAESLAAAVHDLWEHVRIVRGEVLHELRHRTSVTVESDFETKIVDAERFEKLRAEGLRLNLGCGHIALEPYANVDMREIPGVDVVARLDAIPVGQGEVVEIFSAHVLEHFTRQELARDLLPYWLGLLRPGGVFRAVVPDVEAMALGLSEGSVKFSELREVVLGGQEYEGDFHLEAFSTETLSELLAGAGFVDVEVVDRARRNDICLELEIAARRPA